MGIELSSEEIDAYMLGSPRLILCVNREGKPPLPLPMWFGWVEGKIVMHTVLASKKVAPIRRDPVVSCLVESGVEYFKLKAALVIGHCEVVDEQEAVRGWMARMNESKPMYNEMFPSELPDHLERLYAQPRAALIVTPDSITSWDFAKVRR